MGNQTFISKRGGGNNPTVFTPKLHVAIIPPSTPKLLRSRVKHTQRSFFFSRPNKLLPPNSTEDWLQTLSGPDRKWGHMVEKIRRENPFFSFWSLRFEGKRCAEKMWRSFCSSSRRRKAWGFLSCTSFKGLLRLSGQKKAWKPLLFRAFFKGIKGSTAILSLYGNEDATELLSRSKVWYFPSTDLCSRKTDAPELQKYRSKPLF